MGEGEPSRAGRLMARTQATTLTSIWSDPDFVALTTGAQRAYWLLLSQPKLTLCGSLDWHPKRWARLAADSTTTDIEDGVAELAESRFVVVHDDELILRTFVANDLGRGTVNGNLVKGMWSAWGALVSPLLRKVVVDEMPPQVWNRAGIDRPSEAEELRSEPRLELPLGPRPEPSFDLLSVPCSLLTAPVASPQTTPKGAEPSDPDAAAEDREQAVRAAAVAVGRTVAADKGATAGYAATVTKRILTDPDRTDRDRIRAMVDQGQTPDQIAAAWTATDPYPAADSPAPTAPRLRAVGDEPDCGDCLGSGWVSEPGSSEAKRCGCNPAPWAGDVRAEGGATS